MRSNKYPQPSILIIAPPQTSRGELAVLLAAAMPRILTFLNDVDIGDKLPYFWKLLAELPLGIPADNLHLDACSIEKPVANVKQK